jgi:hypothetical protein
MPMPTLPPKYEGVNEMSDLVDAYEEALTWAENADPLLVEAIRDRVAVLPSRPAVIGVETIREIAAERRRQVEKEGWTLAHDDLHDKGEMAEAAACYAILAAQKADRTPYDDRAGRVRWRRRNWAINRHWRWAWDWWKPKTARQDLIRAGALIIAEIERLDRAALSKANPSENETRKDGKP